MKKVNYFIGRTFLLFFLINLNCRKHTAPEPEDLNKHLSGKVYDQTDGERLNNCRVGLYKNIDDGSINNGYKKLAETYTDGNGNYEFAFTKVATESYAIQLEQSLPGYTEEYFPTDIQPQEERKKEIIVDIKVKPLSYLKWHIVGDKGNASIFVNIGGQGQGFPKGADDFYCLSLQANDSVRIIYTIQPFLPDTIKLRKDLKIWIPKNDTAYMETHF
jgi:hypothetical protein